MTLNILIFFTMVFNALFPGKKNEKKSGLPSSSEASDEGNPDGLLAQARSA